MLLRVGPLHSSTEAWRDAFSRTPSRTPGKKRKRNVVITTVSWHYTVTSNAKKKKKNKGNPPGRGSNPQHSDSSKYRIFQWSNSILLRICKSLTRYRLRHQGCLYLMTLKGQNVVHTKLSMACIMLASNISFLYASSRQTLLRILSWIDE